MVNAGDPGSWAPAAIFARGTPLYSINPNTSVVPGIARLILPDVGVNIAHHHGKRGRSRILGARGNLRARHPAILDQSEIERSTGDSSSDLARRRSQYRAPPW